MGLREICLIKIIKIAIILHVLLFLNNISYAQALVINEIQSSNATTIADEDGDYEDWIELYNGTDTTINLAGYYLSDDINNPMMWAFPEVIIEPSEFILVFASGKDKYITELHTNFSIDIDGENILLSNPNGELIDYTFAVYIQTDNSYGRKPDGSPEFFFFQGSTPGFTNNNQELVFELFDEIFFSHQQGFYTDEFYLKVTNSIDNAEIRYTLNGSNPDLNSPILNDSILIYNRQNDPNNFSMIRTNPESTAESFIWREPEENIFKGNILKIRTFINDTAISPVYTQSFFVAPDIFNRYNLPVISIVTDSLNLFDYETGIYVHGYHHYINPDCSWPWGTGNYHQSGEDWERPANISFFENNGNIAFQQDIGIRIHGDGSRALPQKSLRLYARNRYGNKTFSYKFFPEKDVLEYHCLLLRNSGQDFLTTMLTDALTHRLVEHLDLETQSIRPSAVFINGEFWGIHHIRDRIDKYYLSYNNIVNPDKIDYLENDGTIKQGSNTDYLNLLDFIENNNLKIEDNYNFVAEQIDIDNYIDYIIAKQYLSIYDWPGNNIEFWREQESGAKWRWLFFDNDMSMVNYDFNTLIHSTIEDNNEWPNPDWSTFLIRNMLKSDIFKDKYLQRFEYHLNNTFTEEKILNELYSIKNQIAPVMNEQIQRWNYPIQYSTWNYYIGRIENFAEHRPCFMLYHLIEFFNIEDPEYAYGVCDSLDKNREEHIISEQIIGIWPNPATDFINIKINEEGKISVSIFDMTGRIVLQEIILKHNKEELISLKIDNLQSGTYVVNIKSDISRTIKRITIIK